MTYKEVGTLIAGIGLDYAYNHFTDDTEHELPYICFYFSEAEDFVADDTNYQKIRPLDIELYTENKDYDIEETVENALNEAGLVYDKSETFLESELMYMVVFTTSVVITEEVPEPETTTEGE